MPMRRSGVCVALAAMLLGGSAAGVARGQDELCRVPDALRLAGDKESARVEYIGVLVREPRAPCAIRGLRLLAKPVPADAPTCDAANLLREKGFKDEAKAAYVKVLEADSAAACASSGLTKLQRKGFRARVVAEWEDWGKFLTALLSFFAIGVAIWIALPARWLQRGGGRIPRTVRSWFRPRLKLESFREATGTASDTAVFDAGLRRTLATSAGSAPPFSLDTASPYEGLGDALAKAGETVAPLKTIGAIATALAQASVRPRFALSGTLAKHSAMSVTLFLEEAGRTRGTQRLTLPPSVTRPVDALAAATAGWVRHRLEGLRGHLDTCPTRSAASHGFLTAGLQMQLLGQHDDALVLYIRALEADAANAASWVAFAILIARREDELLQASDYALQAAMLIEARFAE